MERHVYLLMRAMLQATLNACVVRSIDCLQYAISSPLCAELCAEEARALQTKIL